MADVTLNQVKKSYGNLNILHGIDLDIKSGEFIVFVGPSGCGKSLTMRPSIAIVPDVTSSRPAIIRSRVVFPQPDGPTSTRNSL